MATNDGTTLDEELESAEVSEFARTIAGMPAEQFARVTQVVNAERDRRADPFAKAGQMTDHQLRDLTREHFGFMPRF